jgi:glycosyltransferase involved in cell wall biosynthesis
MQELRIVVPSYNRYEQLIRNIERLNEIASNTQQYRVHVIVLDNCSTDERYTGLCDIVAKHESAKFSIIRRGANIGIYRNIRDSFNFSSSDWLWIMSDDDEILVRSFDFLEQCGDFDLVIVRANVVGFPIKVGNKLFENSKQIMEYLPSYSVIGFISTTIYSRSLVDKMTVPETNQVDHFEWTLFPHVKLLFEVLSKDPNLTAIVLADFEYVKWTAGVASYKENHDDAIAGMYALFCLVPSYRDQIFLNFSQHFSYSHFLKPMLLDLRILVLSIRCFGIMRTIQLFFIGVGKLWEKIREKVCRLTYRT